MCGRSERRRAAPQLRGSTGLPLDSIRAHFIPAHVAAPKSCKRDTVRDSFHMRAREESYPECVKKQGCCQDQREVSSHGGERASRGGCLDQEPQRGSLRSSSPVTVKNPPLSWSRRQLGPPLCSVSALRLCPEFPRFSHVQVSAPLSTKAQPASLPNPSSHPVQENSTHALKETLVGRSCGSNDHRRLSEDPGFFFFFAPPLVTTETGARFYGREMRR